MKKKHKIVMLPTEDRTSCLYRGIGTSIIVFEEHRRLKEDPLNNWESQHLYILSDDEIKEGDWYAYKDRFLDGTAKTQEEFNQANWNVKQCEANEIVYIQRAQQGKNAKNGICGCYKIIVTTNPKLNRYIENNRGEGVDEIFPQIPKSLIKYYAKHQPEEVELEYEDYTIDDLFDLKEESTTLKLQNNEIMWVEAKEKLYTRKEVEKIVREFSDYADSCIDHEGIMNACCSIKSCDWDEEQWLKENL